MSTTQLPVVILGASAKPDRYANRAQKALINAGYTVIPVSSQGISIDGVAGVKNLTDIREKVDTVTIYVRPEILDTQLDSLLALNPRRVIFNPGTENPSAQAALRAAGIQVLEACTLVLLSIGQFETA